jgi:uncharacterized RDD family membrane protein YckC
MKTARNAGISRRPLGAENRPMTAIVPPEGVPLHFEIAGLGGRLAAQIVDILITVGLAVAVILLIALLQMRFGSSLLAIGALLLFVVRAPYYVATELLWNGQTIGKRICALRVISGNGRSLSAHQVVARNLMKEMEVFLPGTYVLVASNLGAIADSLILAWIVVLIAVPVLNRRHQRIGDIIAETIVIHQPRKMLEPDLAAAASVPTRQRFVFLPHQLEHYGAFELQVLERILQGGGRVWNAAEDRRKEINLSIIFDRVRAKIGYGDRVGSREKEAFLRAFYVAQRAHLEQRQLFGDVRADKFHKERKAGAETERATVSAENGRDHTTRP